MVLFSNIKLHDHSLTHGKRERVLVSLYIKQVTIVIIQYTIIIMKSLGCFANNYSKNKCDDISTSKVSERLQSLTSICGLHRDLRIMA